MQHPHNMHAGTIEWNGADLSGIGAPKLSIRRVPDPPPPGFATRMLVTLTVSVDLEAMDPGTIQARAQWLAEAMKVPEGILRSSTGSGHSLSWLACPGENNLAEVMSGRSNRMELSFTASESHPTGQVESLTRATFTPAGTTTAITLHAVRDLKEEIRTARHSERSSARSSTTTTYAFTARFAQANVSDTAANRLAYLQAQAQAVKSIDAREGVLIIGSFNSIVRVTDFTPLIDERNNVLDVQVQCYAINLPDNATAECMIDMDSRVDEGSGEEVISIKGEISAQTRAIALAKLQSLRAQQNSADRRVVSYTTSSKSIDGKDTIGVIGGDWTGTMSYSMEVRKPRTNGHHTLKISTQRDLRAGMKWSYSGTVIAATQAAALATARAIAAAASHPIMTRSEESIELATRIDFATAKEFVKLDFSYEFEGPSDGFIGLEMKVETVTPLAGEWRFNISGYAITVSEAAARNKIDPMIEIYGTPIEITNATNYIHYDDGSTSKIAAMRFDFSASIRITRERACVEYTDSVQDSLSQMRSTRTLSGTLWTNSQSNAESALSAFLTSQFGTKGAQEVTRTHSKIQFSNRPTVATTAGGGSQWIKLDFTAAKTTRLTGTSGYDLMEATMTMERSGSINSTIVTPIPFGRAVAQTGVGWIPAKLSISATAKAVNLSTARAWVQSKRSLASIGGTAHETEQPRETATPEYAPNEGSAASLWSFSGSYGWTYTGTGTDGVWTTNLPS